MIKRKITEIVEEYNDSGNVVRKTTTTTDEEDDNNYSSNWWSQDVDRPCDSATLRVGC